MYSVMGTAHRQTLSVLALGFLLAHGPVAVALDPSLDISQYAHTAWTIRGGFCKGTITSLVQTPDGYLWLGTEFGLLRFDGVRAVPWQPPAGQYLPDSYIRSLLAGRDRTLWIGTAAGLASWTEGKLTVYPELAGRSVDTLLEDHEGTVWAAAQGTPSARLCAIHGGNGAKVQCYGQDGTLGPSAEPLYEDALGNLWVGGLAGLWRWRPGPGKLYPMPSSDGIHGLLEGEGAALLIAQSSGIRQLVNGKVEAYPIPVAGSHFSPREMLRDRDGGLWIGTKDVGLVHEHDGRVDVFGESDGLSGNFIEKLFEDREGNVWAATLDGLDRFRDFAFPTISVKQGLSNPVVESVLSARDGSVWLGTVDGLDRWDNGQITIYRKRGARVTSETKRRQDGGEPGIFKAVRQIIDDGLPDNAIESLFQDDLGQIWVSTLHGVAYLKNARFITVSEVPGVVHSIAEDRSGNVWISQDQSLFRLRGGSVVERIPWTQFGRPDAARSLVADPTEDGLWLGFRDGGLGYFQGGHLRATYTIADGLGSGHIRELQLGRNGILWASTEGGLSRLKDGRIATLSSRNGLPCDGILWAMEDDEHSLWLSTACGLVRIAGSEMETWLATADKDPKQRIHATLFDTSDGVRYHASSTGYSPSVAKAPDGRIWFLPWDGVSVIDPRHLHFNQLPPPVQIEEVFADRKAYEVSPNLHLRLPPLVRDLEVDYTALSFVAGEKVLFRYKLEGRDPNWQDAGNRRQAFYTNLGPGSYRFQVIACNNSGVWNESGTVLSFSIAPAYYQTLWFRSVCVAAFSALLLGIFQVRLRGIKQRSEQLILMNAKLEAQIAERKRAEDALALAQAELTRVNRVMLVGETAASIAHEVNQPIAAAITNAGTALRWLAAQPPDVDEARQALGRIVKDGNRAGEVIRRIRGLVKKSPPRRDWTEINDMIQEAVILMSNDAHTNRISVQTRLSSNLPPVLADRVQLQQVILNLIKNGIEAITESGDGPRELLVSSAKDESNGVLIAVRDTGAGFDPQAVSHLFDSFYTTKPEGMGLGLAISRSIIEAHGGRLWATPSSPRGAVFQFTLPAGSDGKA
jgi:signal transduction histidine kinase/ligand-binding sensor domain-containing protein